MKFSNNVRLLTYPCLEEGGASYPLGDYIVRAVFCGETNSIKVEHCVRCAPFISKQIEAGLAAYACIVSIPDVGYRKIEKSNTAHQQISWDSDLSIDPPLLQPVVITLEEIGHQFKKDDHNVHESLRGSKIIIPKGGRLARGQYMRPRVSDGSLLKIVVDEEGKLGNGSFKVAPSHENTFYFTITVAKDLFKFLEVDKNSNLGQYNSIITHMWHACFDILKEKYRHYGVNENDSDETEEMPYSLKRLLESMDAANIKPWWEDGFCSLEAATKFRPHVVIPCLTEDES